MNFRKLLILSAAYVASDMAADRLLKYKGTEDKTGFIEVEPGGIADKATRIALLAGGIMLGQKFFGGKGK